MWYTLLTWCEICKPLMVTCTSGCSSETGACLQSREFWQTNGRSPNNVHRTGGKGERVRSDEEPEPLAAGGDEQS